MTSSIHGLGPSASMPQGPGGGGRAESARGEWNGLAVHVADDPTSLLADAMEEMTFAASEKVEKTVAERKRGEKGGRLREVVPPEEAVTHLQQQMGERLQKLLAAVKAAGGDPARLRAALDGFPDPTERHAAMLWLEERLADDPALAQTVREARLAFEAEAAAAIQAGYNIADVDAGAAGGAAAGRDLYRRTVLGHGDIGPMLDDILERNGDGDFAETVDFLRRAVAADLSATNASTDKRELESLNNDLYHLRALANFTRSFGDDLTRLRGEGGKPPLPRAPVDTLHALCKAKEARLANLDGLKTVLALEGSGDPTYDVRALSLAQRLAHTLPAKLFTGEDARRRLLDAGQKLLDAAIDLEESLLAEDGD